MDRTVTSLNEPHTEFDFEAQYADLLDAIDGISERKIEAYFNSKAIGAKSKSLASTVRALITNDLQLKGWVLNWKPFRGDRSLESALWSFDAAKHVALGSDSVWLTAEISFDNRVAVGTHLSKATVANNLEYRKSENIDPIGHHCIVAATSAFKLSAGIDSSVASSEEFDVAAGPYKDVIFVPTTLVAIKGLVSLELSQRKSEGRLRSRLTLTE